MCDKVACAHVCERELCVTKLCGRVLCDKVVCDKNACERNVRQSCVRVVCVTSHQSQTSAISTTPATQSEGRCHQAPRLPRRMQVDVAKCHACRAKWRSMLLSATPTAAATTVDVSLCHACHAKCRGVTGAQARPSAPPSAICPTPAT